MRKIKFLLNHPRAIIPKLQRLLFHYIYKPKILESPSVDEIELIEQIRSKASHLLMSQVILDNPWSQYRKRLLELIVHDDLRNFLNWDLLKETMFYEPDIQELDKLKQQNWQFWQKAIAEDFVGIHK